MGLVSVQPPKVKANKEVALALTLFPQGSAQSKQAKNAHLPGFPWNGFNCFSFKVRREGPASNLAHI